MFSNIY